MHTARHPDAISVQALHKDYDSPAGRYAVLRDVSVGIPRGGFVCVLGPSGSGKSTLLNVMAGLDRADGGQLLVNGQPLRGRPPIAYMQQKDLLLPWRTLWDNILLGPELRSRTEKRAKAVKARELVAAFHLEGFTGAYPSQLSGGMRQRASLIRTLLCEQELLLLDEPFGALDALTRTRLQRLLLDVWRRMGKTIVLVTHDVEEAILLATRIVLLTSRPGRIAAQFELGTDQRQRASAPETARLKAQILALLDVNGHGGRPDED